MTGRFILTTLLTCGIALMTGTLIGASPKSIKLLTIGNSFADNAVKYLNQIVQADKDCNIIIGKANIGGCPMDKHVKLFKESEADPSKKPYWYSGENGKKRCSLKEILQARQWDVVTIQQLSNKSPDIKTFHPYAEELYKYIKKYAPNAEVMIHQTWAYRADYSQKRKDFNQQVMYDKLTKNYQQIAKELKCRILPSGSAMQAVREKQTVKFIFPDPDFDYKKPIHPALPQQQSSLIVGYSWRKDKKTGKYNLGYDYKHANKRGELLQGLVWYEMLFGKDARKNTYKPSGITDEDACFLRKTAHETVSTFPQQI